MARPTQFIAGVPESITDYLRMESQIRQFREMGDLENALALERLMGQRMFDPEAVARSRELMDFRPDLPRPDEGAAYRFRTGLTEDLPAPEVDLVGDQMLQDVGRSYDSLASGRLRNLNNQRTGLIDAARQNIFEAAAARRGETSFRDPLPLSKEERLLQQAGEVIDRRQLPVRGSMQDRLSPNSSSDLANIATAAAIIGGVGGLAGSTIRGLGRGPAVTARAPELDYPELQQFPDVPMMEEEVPVPQETFSTPEMPSMDDMLGVFDTADLVAESRPIPDSTPRVEQLTPEEIAMLRPQVISIRDAKTGQAVNSFYPPESEEYKREQRMKQRYPQLRMR